MKVLVQFKLTLVGFFMLLSTGIRELITKEWRQLSWCVCVVSCKAVKYPKHLPTASVVIVFCNEAPSAILRTIHSVVNRTPPEYLHEVVLLDDASDRRNFIYVFVWLFVHFCSLWMFRSLKLFSKPGGHRLSVGCQYGLTNCIPANVRSSVW